MVELTTNPRLGQSLQVASVTRPDASEDGSESLGEVHGPGAEPGADGGRGPVILTSDTLNLARFGSGFCDLPTWAMTEIKERVGLMDHMEMMYGAGLHHDDPCAEWVAEKIEGFRTCGSRGAVVRHEDGAERYHVYNCQQRALCPRCSELYWKGKAVDLQRELTGVMEGGSGSRQVYLANMEFTLPDELSEHFAQIRGESLVEGRSKIKQIRNAMYHAAKETMMEWFAPGEDGAKIGGAMFLHEWGSGSEKADGIPSLSPHFHIHAVVPSVYLRPSGDGFEVGHLKRSGFVNEKKAWEELREKWREKVYEKLSAYFPDGYELPKELVVHYKYVKFIGEKGRRQVGHRVRYMVRSLWTDIFRDWSRIADSINDGSLDPKGDLVRYVRSVYPSRFERLRYFGFMSKSKRREYFPYFGMELRDDEASFEDEHGEIVEELEFQVISRDADQIAVRITGEGARLLERSQVQGERLIKRGQYWARSGEP